MDIFSLISNACFIICLTSSIPIQSVNTFHKLVLKFYHCTVECFTCFYVSFLAGGTICQQYLIISLVSKVTWQFCHVFPCVQKLNKTSKTCISIQMLQYYQAFKYSVCFQTCSIYLHVFLKISAAHTKRSFIMCTILLLLLHVTILLSIMPNVYSLAKIWLTFVPAF